MSYKRSRAIRRSSLGRLIVNRTISGQGFLGSVRSSISDKTKAGLTGIAEKFDPMNIGKAVGGRLGAYAVGKLTGRSQEDISYFTGAPYSRGDQKSKPVSVQKKNNPLYTKISASDARPSKKGDGLADVLSRIFNLLRKESDENVKKHELEKNFERQKEDEREERHKELIKALSGLGTATKVEPEDKKNGIFDFIKKMFDSFLDDFKILKDIVLKYGPNLMRIIGTAAEFAAGPLAFLAGVGALAYLAKVVQDKLEESTEKQFGKAGGEKAEKALKEVHDERRGRDVENASPEQAESVQKQLKSEIKATDEIKKKQDLIQSYMQEKGYKKYAKTALGLTYGYEYDDKNGKQAPESLLKEADDYAEKEMKKQEVTAPKAGATASSVPSPSSTPASAAPSASPVSSEPSSTSPSTSTPSGTSSATPSATSSPAGAPSATPMPAEPSVTGQNVQAAISENKNLEMNQSASQGQTVVIDKSKNVGGGGAPGPAVIIDSSAPVRIDDPTLKYIQEQNLRKF